jgi:hypothetical protein
LHRLTDLSFRPRPPRTSANWRICHAPKIKASLKSLELLEGRLDLEERAVAVRAENAAVRPFLGELEQLRGERDETWRDWIESWRQLVDARIAYADALDRQATGAEPAFFVAPQGRHGTPVVERLTDHSPDSCDGAIRRLAGPDL